MKKRIISLLLAITVLVVSVTFPIRKASAAAEVSIIVAIGVLAWELIGVCTGMYDDTAEAIGDFLEVGVDGFTNPDSPFQQNWSTGWNQICDTVTGWFDAGELQIVDGQIKLTYDQYLELYGQVLTVSAKPDIKFDCGYDFTFITPFYESMSAASVPHSSYINMPRLGQSVIPVFYNDDSLYFGSFFYYMYNNPYDPRSWNMGVRYLSSNISAVYNIGGFGCSEDSFKDVILSHQPNFSVKADYGSESFYFNGSLQSYNKSLDYLFCFDGTSVVTVPSSDFSYDGLIGGYIITTSDVPSFLKSIKGYTPDTVVQDLDDLSDTIPTEYNPSLSFPVHPDLTRPISNQITVGDVPGSPDLPLSDYQADVDIDLDIPSIIVSKFPFCIPFDFVRFLSVLLADPVAPVFRIPISTSPDNLEQWEGNQTVGDYLNPDNPMFEIDEEIVIDLSVIPLVQPISYTCFIVGFIFLLLHITSKMIQH